VFFSFGPTAPELAVLLNPRHFQVRHSYSLVKPANFLGGIDRVFPELYVSEFALFWNVLRCYVDAGRFDDGAELLARLQLQRRGGLRGDEGHQWKPAIQFHPRQRTFQRDG
jgi:hypothetical protein